MTRHADVMAVSKRSDVFRNGKGYRPDAAPVPHMVAMDRPEHMVRRNLVNRGFTPRRVSAYEPRVREICTHILDDVAERGACDFVRDVAAPLPLIVIGDLLGVDPADHERLLRWSDDLMRGLGSKDPALLAAQVRAGMEVREYCMQAAADRRARPPADDLISVLVHAEVDGARLDDESLFMESLLDPDRRRRDHAPRDQRRHAPAPAAPGAAPRAARGSEPHPAGRRGDAALGEPDPEHDADRVRGRGGGRPPLPAPATACC